jgi:HPt (histidine-containing phosphotransfer) domain-containing protein
VAGARGTEWDAELERLRERYRGRLRRDIEALDALLREARTARSALEEAHRVAHRLKGTSGSYGLCQSSEALEQIESQLADLLGGPPDPGAGWNEIEQSLLRARSGVDQRVALHERS